MPTAHCIGSTIGVILEVDDSFCQMMARDKVGLIGLSYKDFTVEDDIESSASMLAAIAEYGIIQKISKRYYRPDRSIVNADLLVTRFDADKVVTTLFWRAGGDVIGSPEAMWKMALHASHLYAWRWRELGPELFCDYVGALLIQVYLAEAEGRLVTIEDIADVTGLFPTVAGRWVAALRQKGLMQPPAPCVSTVQLSAQGIAKVERLLTMAMQPAL